MLFVYSQASVLSIIQISGKSELNY